MFYGQPGRMTEDIDVWSPRSQVDVADLAQACAKAGVGFNPLDLEIQAVGLYIQMITPGIVHVGKWKEDACMFSTGNLQVVHPPAENVIASKLVRGEPYDIEDVVYLMRRLDVSLEQVRGAVATLTGFARERAEENIVFIELQQAAVAGARMLDSPEPLGAPAPAEVPPAAARKARP